MLVVLCAYQACRLRKPVGRMISHAGRHYCSVECLDAHVKEMIAKEEEVFLKFQVDHRHDPPSID